MTLVLEVRDGTTLAPSAIAQPTKPDQKTSMNGFVIAVLSDTPMVLSVEPEARKQFTFGSNFASRTFELAQ